MVSVADTFQLKLSEITDNEIERLEKELNNLESKGYQNGYIGGWLDAKANDKNNFYLDISINIQDRNEAIELAKKIIS